MANKVKLNRAGMAKMMKSSEMATMLHDRAERVAQAARSAAPVKSGAYAANIEVVDEVHGDRVVSRAVATSPYAQRVESSHRVLGTAIDAAR